MRKHLAWGVLALAMAGCWPAPDVGERVDPTLATLGDTHAKFSEIAEVILVPSCASSYCHSGNPPLAAPMTLEALEAYDALVNVPASQVSSMKRVEPGDPQRSYLIHKIRGTARDVGGNGTRMPVNKGMMDERSILLIEDWIARGAPND